MSGAEASILNPLKDFQEGGATTLDRFNKNAR